MQVSRQIAEHFRGVYFGGNWTWVNLQDTLHGITHQEAVAKIGSLHNMATLLYHMHYYVRAVTQVLQGAPLQAHDKYAFDVPEIRNAEEWDSMVSQYLEEGRQFARLVEQLPDDQLEHVFSEAKYGSYYRNLHGLIEHTHYHLGQMALIKKLLREKQAG